LRKRKNKKIKEEDRRIGNREGESIRRSRRRRSKEEEKKEKKKKTGKG